MSAIEPGDLIRWGDGSAAVAEFVSAEGPAQIIAKGPGWTRHDGSSVNPVPGAECRVYMKSQAGGHLATTSGSAKSDYIWTDVLFYRVTREAPSQPPAPQPGWVATVELRFFENQGGMAGITFPSGWTHYVDPRTVDKLDWQPPPPPPWEPEIGGPATYGGDRVTVEGLKNGMAWIQYPMGDLNTVFISRLSPPKGGEA